MLRGILLTGMLLRWVVFYFISPTNPDDHFSVIEHAVREGKLPSSIEYTHSFHPPLYYLLSVPLVREEGVAMKISKFLYGGVGERYQRMKATQLLNFILSVSALLFIYWGTMKIFASCWARVGILMLAAFSPQWICFSLYLSNDSLSYLLGILFLVMAWRLMEKKRGREVVFLGGVTGLGLLTKGTFLAFIPAGAVWVWYWMEKRRKITWVILYLMVTVALGSYKWVENKRALGVWMVHNMDFSPEWRIQQLETIQGASSYLDINFWKLLNHPWLSPETKHSIPLLMFASSCYPHLITETNFRAAQALDWKWLPGWLYCGGLAVLLVAAYGGGVLQPEGKAGRIIKNGLLGCFPAAFY